MMQIYLVSALVFSLLVAVFAIQNTEIVVIKFLTWQFSVSLVLVILGAAVIGAMALLFLGLFKQFGSWITIRQLTHRNEDLEKQVKGLEEKVKNLEAEKNASLENLQSCPATGGANCSAEKGVLRDRSESNL